MRILSKIMAFGEGLQELMKRDKNDSRDWNHARQLGRGTRGSSNKSNNRRSQGARQRDNQRDSSEGYSDLAYPAIVNARYITNSCHHLHNRPKALTTKSKLT